MADKDCGCGCGGGRPAVRIVRGNDFTVEASASVYDADKGIYVPYDLSGAEDVELNIVGLYAKVAGGGASVSGNRVSAGFTGAAGAGVYGVEVLFRDAGGRGRVFERGLFEVVEDSGDASIGSSAEGGSGEGLNVSVDLRTRTVRVGQTTGVTDYSLLDNKPSIGGVELKGDRTAEELGLYSREEADALLGVKADKSDVPAKTSELENDSDYATNAKVDSSVEALKPYDCTWAWDLSQGDEAPADKVDELRKAINAKRPLYTESTNSNGFLLNLGVLAKLDDKDDTIITLTAIGRYSSNIYGSWVIIDDKTSDDYAYSVVSKGEKALQDVLVSGESIKTVNGESLLGSGDITISGGGGTADETDPVFTEWKNDYMIAAGKDASVTAYQGVAIGHNALATDIAAVAILAKTHGDRTFSIKPESLDKFYFGDKTLKTLIDEYVAANLPVDSALSETSENPVQNKAVKAALETKVDKESGKGLSTNDYTDADKAKVAAALTEHQSLDGYARTADIPTKTSELTNDADYQTAAQVQTMIDNAVTTALNTEV